ncbi:hypothetical protein, partial [Streptomyces sp. YS415]|uniref:hypothetical protein n=1 Tax=Streptomyces sp. YS415 TaxID=2944806 RepID=UPI002020F5D6
MSRPPQYGDGTNGVNAPNGVTGPQGGGPQGEGPQVPPRVYVPQAAPSPDYEEYPDPAVAHGWQNAYDETSRLPRVPGAPDGGWEPGTAGRAARRSHRRRERRRPVLMAAGALGAVSVAALVAGFGFSSDSSSGGPEGKKDPARSAKDDAGTPTDRSATPSPASTGASEAPGATASPGGTEPEEPKDSGEDSAPPAT